MFDDIAIFIQTQLTEQYELRRGTVSHQKSLRKHVYAYIYVSVHRNSCSGSLKETESLEVTAIALSKTIKPKCFAKVNKLLFYIAINCYIAISSN